MRYSKKLGIVAIGVALALPGWLAAAEPQNCPLDYHYYQLVDVGTFGGPNSQFGTPSTRVINNRGISVGVADTNVPDPTCYFDCVVDRPFVRKDGVTTDLGTLPGGVSAFAYSINDEGVIIGSGQNGSIDPNTGGLQLRGLMWRDGHISDLGTLGGYTNNPFAINDLGEVVGGTTNSTPDPFADSPMPSCHAIETSVCPDVTFAFSALFTATTTETRAFLWRNGVLHDLGTLGGPDSVAEMINQRGDITGWSYTSFTPNPSTGVPQVNPFYWDAQTHRMTDMGSLGGTFGAPFWINNRGQVVGASNLPGDQIIHPFIWSMSRGMLDLGTLGGGYGHADWINDAGDVVGLSELTNKQKRAFFWHDGKMQDLGAIGTDRDSEATSINARGQVVGVSGEFGVADLHGFIWNRHGSIVDLNDLVVAGTTVQVVSATDINERGEIAGSGVLPNGAQHAIVLIPCDNEHRDIKGCDYRRVQSAP